MTGYIDLREKVVGGFSEMGKECDARAYAERLASYIGDPSTVRARTFNEYGKAPPIDTIKAMQAKARGKAEFVRHAATWDMPDASEDPQFWGLPGYARIARERREAAQILAELSAGNRIAKRAEDQVRWGNDVVTIREVVSEAARAFDMTYADMIGRSRARDVMQVRHFVMWVLKQRGRMSMAQIGRALGGRDHTTVLYGLRTFEKRATPELRATGMTIARMGQLVQVDAGEEAEVATTGQPGDAA